MTPPAPGAMPVSAASLVPGATLRTPRLLLPPHAIDLWLAFYDEIADPRLLDAMRPLLTEPELAQQQRFHFADDRQRYLVTRALVRTVLSRYAAVAPADWRFVANDYGRPEIAPAHAGRDGVAGLAFNLSHTRGLIVLGVARDRALGVDVEDFARRELSDGIAERFFSPAEAAELAGTPLVGRQRRFFEYWTFKESYIKARGMGLSIPLEQFSFDYPHEHAVRLSIAPALGDLAQRWSLWQFQPTSRHLLAVCAERRAGAPPVLTLRKAVPTRGDSLFETALLKRSDALADSP